MLRILGVEELVVKDIDGYVDLAVNLGTDAAARKGLAARILASRGALFERDEPLRALEDFLERAALEGRAG